MPDDYIDVTTKARKTVTVNNIRRECPFEAIHLRYDFFLNFANKDQLRFQSIRPGMKKGDPTVNNLRSMVYLPNGEIKYKIDFDDEYRDLPRKIIPFDCEKHNPQSLHKNRLKIKKTKYEHLQQLKSVIPETYHKFYDNLPYE